MTQYQLVKTKTTKQLTHYNSDSVDTEHNRQLHKHKIYVQQKLLNL